MWICDVYEGALICISAFFSIVPKTIIFCLLFKFVLIAFLNFNIVLSPLLTLAGLTSVAISSVVALYQKKKWKGF
jgi:NADH:ubiquinone oxidoreductase subunit 2 (subunit N)